MKQTLTERLDAIESQAGYAYDWESLRVAILDLIAVVRDIAEES